MNDNPRFHSKDGLYFERQGDGSVLVQREFSGGVVLDPSTWASVVASMSAEGENGATHSEALARQIADERADVANTCPCNLPNEDCSPRNCLRTSPTEDEPQRDIPEFMMTELESFLDRIADKGYVRVPFSALLVCRWCLNEFDSSARHGVSVSDGTEDGGEVICLWPCNHEVQGRESRCYSCEPLTDADDPFAAASPSTSPEQDKQR